MPEVNEIRRFADFIKSKTLGKNITEINILNGRYKKHGAFDKYNELIKNLPLKVIDVKTKGKFLYIILENNFYLFSTLGLNGGWCYLKKNGKIYEFSENMREYSKYLSQKQIDQYYNNAINHLNVEFKTNNGSLYYHDVLSFGSIKIVDNIGALEKKLSSIGPDIMDSDTNFELFYHQITKNKNLNKEIGIVLLDQKTISGIGNYLRCDVLYISKINPFKKVKYLSKIDIRKIYKNSKILTWGVYDKKKAIKLGIISSSTKFPSNYNKLFYVYNQTTDIFGNKVIKKELYEGSQKRFIYYVPKIQK